MRHIVPLILAGLLAVSCNFGRLSLDQTSWVPESFEDIFNGTVAYEGYLSGEVYAEASGSELNLYLTIPEFGMNDDGYRPDEYRIVRQTSDELVFDLLPYTYNDIRRSDCEEALRVNGTRVYYTVYDGYDTYVYFKPNGTAVEVYYEDIFSEPYYYDTTRIYCTRR